jgi:hypothetical protein
VGLFPANYVTVPDADHAPIVPAASTSVKAQDGFSALSANFSSERIVTPDGISERRTELDSYDEAEIHREMNEIVKQPPQKSPKATKSRRYEIATVLANYQATSEGQLNLARGQLMTVRKRSPSGWWEGELQVIFDAEIIIEQF